MPVAVRTKLGLAVLATALTAAAAGTWRGKPADAWSTEEALELLNDSPWARSVELYQPSGRRLGVYPDGRKVVLQDTPTSPERIYSPAPPASELELLRAVYAVRWSSAHILQQALERLRELSPAVAEAQSAPAELSADHFVLTVRVVVPPTESPADRLSRPLVLDEHGRPTGPDEPLLGRALLDGLSEEELRRGAELRFPGGRLPAERAQRHGLGTSEGVSFYFPRRGGERASIPPGASWVEFQFNPPGGITLKARFRPAEMRAAAKPDF